VERGLKFESSIFHQNGKVGLAGWGGVFDSKYIVYLRSQNLISYAKIVANMLEDKFFLFLHHQGIQLGPRLIPEVV